MFAGDGAPDDLFLVHRGTQLRRPVGTPAIDRRAQGR